MKLRRVSANSRRHEFSVTTRSGQSYSFPYANAEPQPNREDRVENVFVDKELGNEAFTYILRWRRGKNGYGERVESGDEVEPALQRALHAVRVEKRQALLNVICKRP